MLSAIFCISSWLIFGLCSAIESIEPTLSPLNLGTMCAWTWGISCPLSFPLLMAIVVACAPTAFWIGSIILWMVRKNASAVFSSSFSNLETWILGITRVCPFAKGLASRKANVFSSSNTVCGLISPFAILQNTQLLLISPIHPPLYLSFNRAGDISCCTTAKLD